MLEVPGGRAWLSAAMASWFDLLAVDLLGYALMGNHVHLVVRTRPDVAKGWDAAEVRRRLAAMGRVHDGRPVPVDGAQARSDDVGVVEGRRLLAHPGAMLAAVKEGFARRLNQADGTAGHVWEGRYHDVALVDAGAVLACLVYVDLNPFRAGLVEDPALSTFCSARHRRGVDAAAEDAPLARCLAPLGGHPLLDGDGREEGSWAWDAAAVAELTAATARTLRDPGVTLPAWAEDLFPRLGLDRACWSDRMGVGGAVAGSVLGRVESRRRYAGVGRLPSDKSGWFVS